MGKIPKPIGSVGDDVDDEETSSMGKEAALVVPLAVTLEGLSELDEFGELDGELDGELVDGLVDELVDKLDGELDDKLDDKLDDELNESLEEASSLSINNDESVIEEGCSLEEAVLEEEGELVESPEQRLEFSVQ